MGGGGSGEPTLHPFGTWLPAHNLILLGRWLHPSATRARLRQIARSNAERVGWLGADNAQYVKLGVFVLVSMRFSIETIRFLGVLVCVLLVSSHIQRSCTDRSTNSSLCD